MLSRHRPTRTVAVGRERYAGILGTLQDIGTAAADVEGCSRLLAQVCDELQAEQGVLILCNPLTKELEFVVHNQDPAVPRSYGEYYCDLDPTGLPEYVKGTGPSLAPPTVPSVSDLMEVVDYTALVCTEFYNDFFRSAGIHYDLVAFMAASSLARGALCVHRARWREPFSAEELGILEMITPFVSNHLERMVSASVLSVLQTTEDKGVILCDTNGRVLYCNQIARDLCSPLGQLEGLRLRADGNGDGEGPVARGPARAADVWSNDGMVYYVGYGLSNPRTLAESCNVGVVSRTISLDQDRQAVLIILEPGAGNTRWWREPLKERFALTDREIEVLQRVIAGESNKEISNALFIAECTVKKHLQNIAAKVGARSRTAIAYTVRRELGLSI